MNFYKSKPSFVLLVCSTRLFCGLQPVHQILFPQFSDNCTCYILIHSSHPHIQIIIQGADKMYPHRVENIAILLNDPS